MGHKGRVDHPDVQAAMKTLEEAIRPSSVILGGVATTADQIEAMAKLGYQALVVGFDWSLLQKGIASVLGDAPR
jgi:4-hydroxy-2-oxoheptanedioate aldolase